MLVLVRKIKYHLTTPKKVFLVPSCLVPHSCTGLRENGYGPVKKREFWNSTLTTPNIIEHTDLLWFRYDDSLALNGIRLLSYCGCGWCVVEWTLRLFLLRVGKFRHDIIVTWCLPNWMTPTEADQPVAQCSLAAMSDETRDYSQPESPILLSPYTDLSPRKGN